MRPYEPMLIITKMNGRIILSNQAGETLPAQSRRGFSPLAAG